MPTFSSLYDAVKRSKDVSYTHVIQEEERMQIRLRNRP
jgi:hypothetical protein